MEKHRNGAIDLLKFLFGFMIVFYHGRIFSESGRVLFGAGFIAVEFFFLVSGYLMTAKAYRVSQKENILAGKETSDFILKKAKTLLPHLLFIYITYALLLFYLSPDTKSVANIVFLSIWEPLMLWMSGLGTMNATINAQTWYISAMLLSMLILYPILIRKFDLFTRVIAPAAAIFLLGWIAQEYGTLNHYRIWTGIAYSGLFRAIALLCLGSVCWVAAQKLQTIHFTKVGSTLLCLIEILCYLLVVIGANFPSQKRLAFIMVALLAIGVTITFSKTSLIDRWFDRKICYWLGNFSLTVYLNHIIIRKFFQKKVSGLSYIQELLLFIVVVFVWSLIAHFLMRGLQKVGKKATAKLKSWFLEPEESIVDAK